MMRWLRPCLLLAVGAILLPFFLFVSAANAQNEAGTRKLNKAAFQNLRMWYDRSTENFHTRYPIIQSLPPLNSTMPWDVLASYIYLDSLARFDRSEMTTHALDRWDEARAMNDTLRWMAKYLYKLIDHNPYIFTQYLDEISLKYRTRYWADMRLIVSKVGSTFFDALSQAERKRAMLALLESAYILRVTVTAIDSMPTGSSQPGAAYVYRVTARVGDTLKGKAFQSCWNDYSTKEISSSHIAGASGDGCIQFVYLRHHYSNPRVVPIGAPQLYNARDPEFADGADSSFMMKAGQEAVVFLQFNDWLVDSTADYHRLIVSQRASFGALPIIDGKVRDLNAIWSGTELLGYEEWKRNFIALRDRLLAGQF